MCFRPSAVSYDSTIQTTICPNCGEPVSFREGTTEGQCPNCKSYIPPDPSNSYGFDPNQNYRVL